MFVFTYNNSHDIKTIHHMGLKQVQSLTIFPVSEVIM